MISWGIFEDMVHPGVDLEDRVKQSSEVCLLGGVSRNNCCLNHVFFLKKSNWYTAKQN